MLAQNGIEARWSEAGRVSLILTSLDLHVHPNSMMTQWDCIHANTAPAGGAAIPVLTSACVTGNVRQLWL